MWEGESKLQRRGQGPGWRPAKAGPMASQGSLGQRKRQERVGSLSVVVGAGQARVGRGAGGILKPSAHSPYYTRAAE